MSFRHPLFPVLAVIAACGLVWFLQTAEHVMAPLLLALVLGVVISPATDRIERIGVRRSISAFLALFATLAALVLLGIVLGPVISDAIEMAPRMRWELREIMSSMRPALESMTDLQETLEETSATGTRASGAEEGRVAVPNVMDAIWYAPGLAAQAMIFIGTLYFFLLSRSDIYRCIHRGDTNVDAEALKRAEGEVSRYFMTITAINATFGFLIGVVMTLLGMPSPVLWGLGAFFVNYVLYLGPAVFACALLLAGFVVFDGIASVLPALIYLALNGTEGQFVTPGLVGKHMSINPLLVFVSLVFWLWMWGPLGGIIAIPLLVWGLRIQRAIKGDQTISSGTPGRFLPNRRAGATG